jgi:type I restriction enzyme S subunit
MIVSLNNVLQTLESGSRPKGGIKNDTVGIPSLGAEHLDSNGGFNFRNIKYIPNEFFINQKHGVIAKEDILIVKDGATTGKVSFVGNDFLYEKASTNEHLFKLTVDKKVTMPKYVFWYLFSEAGKKQILSDFRGATVGGISREFTKKITFLLPPLEDQKRIVKILDNTDALRQKRKQTIEYFDEYLKSVFLEMFGDPVKNPKGWKIEKLGKLTNKITDGTHKTPAYTTTGIKFISAKNIKEEKITWDDIKYISEEEHQSIYKRCNPERNDLLLTKSGSLGMVALVDVDFEFSLFESLALLKINEELAEPIYLREYLNLKEIKSFYSQRTKGVGVKHLHLIDIKSLPILLPPKREQQKFTHRVQEIKSIKQKMLVQSSEIENQFQALIQKAFKGTL